MLLLNKVELGTYYRNNLVLSSIFTEFFESDGKEKGEEYAHFLYSKNRGIRISPDDFLPTWPPFTGLLTWTIRTVNFHTSRAEMTR